MRAGAGAWPSAAQGYTLIEVLVATLVFGLLAAAAYTALNGLTQAAGAQREHAERLGDVQVTLTRFENDLRQTVWRPVRQPDGDWAAAFQGSPRELSTTRAGWLNPLDQPRANLQRLQWSWADGVLYRSSWPVLDRTASTPVLEDLRLDQVDAFALRYLSPTGQWTERWPAEPVSARDAPLPVAIEITLTVAPLGVIRRLVVL